MSTIDPNSIEVSESVARIHAHICGDGCVYLKREKRSKRSLQVHPRKNLIENVWVIEYTNTCQELLDEFNADLLTTFNRKGQKKLKYHRIKVTSVKWILERMELLNKNSYTWYIPEFILSAGEDVRCAWLKAFFDDEGTVTDTGMVRIKSMNQHGLHQVQRMLDGLHIGSSLRGPNCDNSYYLSIYKRYGRRYCDVIGFNHPQKKNKLRKMMGPRGIPHE